MNAGKYLSSPWVWGALGATLGLIGGVWGQPHLLTTGAAVASWSAWRVGAERLAKIRAARMVVLQKTLQAETPPPAAEDDSILGLVQRMIDAGRSALLLRPVIAADLPPELLAAARDRFQEELALVPGGDVQLAIHDPAEEHARHSGDDEPRETVVSVKSFFLDRAQVTNRQFQAFVLAGGYEQSSLWDPEVLPAVLEFVDSTGAPGPRWWKEGKSLPGESQLPVVGICWHEALAYARWVGKRLPTDAEWVKAASWPVPVSPTKRKQRRYPWGDTMERGRANLWETGLGRIVPVQEFPEGTSVSGALQLIGNVWEWINGDFDNDHNTALGRGLYKSIRGGAFDTYFEHQASCQFASGENPFSRKHNIGFRCAIGWCDIVPAEDWVPVEPPVAVPLAGAGIGAAPLGAELTECATAASGERDAAAGGNAFDDADQPLNLSPAEREAWARTGPNDSGPYAIALQSVCGTSES